MPSGFPEGESVPIEGDDTLLGSIIFGNPAPREFLMNFGQSDLTLDALLQGTTVNTVGNMNFGALDPAEAEYPTVGLIINTRSLKRDTGQAGQSAWNTYMYPAVQVQPLDRETFQGRTAASFRYKGVAQQATNFNWGITVNDVLSTPAITATRINTPYPITMHAFRTDGSAMNIVLDKTPVGATNTTTIVIIERVLHTGYTIVPATRTLTLGSAVTAGRRGVIYYQYS